MRKKWDGRAQGPPIRLDGDVSLPRPAPDGELTGEEEQAEPGGVEDQAVEPGFLLSGLGENEEEGEEDQDVAGHAEQGVGVAGAGEVEGGEAEVVDGQQTGEAFPDGDDRGQTDQAKDEFHGVGGREDALIGEFAR